MLIFSRVGFRRVECKVQGFYQPVLDGSSSRIAMSRYPALSGVGGGMLLRSGACQIAEIACAAQQTRYGSSYLNTAILTRSPRQT